MGRKNKRFQDEVMPLPTIKSEGEWRLLPLCAKFPGKTLFTTPYRAQSAIDDIKATSDRDHTPERVYDCLVKDGGCGYYHITGMRDIPVESE